MSEPLPVVPAPWNLKGKGWVFFTYSPFSETPIPLSEAAYSALEKGSSADQSENYHGGIGIIMLVRYEESDAGPYDELIYVPGWFSKKSGLSDQADTKKEYHLSITRIYVSTAASVVNGRRNWGIPKHLANFTFNPSPTSAFSPLTVSISLPSSSKTFFSATLTPSWLPSMPVKTSWLSNSFVRYLLKGFKFELIQPPLPASKDASFEKEGEKDALVASEKEYLVRPVSKGWSKVTYLTKGEGELEGFGDGVDFPVIKPILGGRGTGMEFEMIFPVAELVA